MNIVVYCSSREGLSSEYVQIAEALGQWIGEHHHTLVYGGVNAGLMHSQRRRQSDWHRSRVFCTPRRCRVQRSNRLPQSLRPQGHHDCQRRRLRLSARRNRHHRRMDFNTFAINC